MAPSLYYIEMHEAVPFVVVAVCGVVAIIFAAFCAWSVSKIVVNPTGEEAALLDRAGIQGDDHKRALEKVYHISQDISDGASAFLFAEYRLMAVYMVMMSIVIVILLGTNKVSLPKGVPHPAHETRDQWVDGVLSAVSFNLGCITSIVAGYIGMRIAVYTNSRTTVCASQGYAPAFATALKGGIVMGFGLTGLGILALLVLVAALKTNYSHLQWDRLMQVIAPFGLGGSSIALFGRVGGGIFTKAADVGADLVGKVEQGIPEDDPRNPGVIADNVGDNVGDIAGMGSDLFGSFAEATCAAFVVSAFRITVAEDPKHGPVPYTLSENFGYLLFPLQITAVGIITCLLCSFVATHLKPPTQEAEIEPALETQLILSTILNTIFYIPLCMLALPKSFCLPMIYLTGNDVEYYGCRKVTWWHVYISIMMGLWSGLIIGLVTKYYTSHSNKPTRRVAEACETGAATNIIQGLALGYESCIIPCFCIGITVYGSLLLCGAYGAGVAALGILSTMPIGLTIDAYGPISDNAGGIAEMAGMGEEVRKRTDALDAAGNTTAAVGKGFAIGSAALVSVALFCAYFTIVSKGASPENSTVNLLDPRTFFGIIVGAMLPYWFSAMTVKSVGSAAMEMVREIQRQFREIPGLMDDENVRPDHNRCIQIATNAALKQMLPPGALVVLSPILVGIFFGPEMLSGMLPSAMASGVMMATSSANTGGAWDNAKKYIEGGHMDGYGKGSDPHHAAVIGDTVGDPLKDTSGPALNILVKLMAIISVVFAPVFTYGNKASGLIFDRLICEKLKGSHVCPGWNAL